jgi:hypothetical protein
LGKQTEKEEDNKGEKRKKEAIEGEIEVKKVT